MAEVNNWKDAIAAWEKGLSIASDKNAGKICYNIAVGYEVLGDMEKAKNWASKSYVEYGNKKARTYGYVIDQRVSSEERAREQMK